MGTVFGGDTETLAREISSSVTSYTYTIRNDGILSMLQKKFTDKTKKPVKSLYNALIISPNQLVLIP
jgi:hypothetical protein